jgi:DNA replication and repair protein RecF
VRSYARLELELEPGLVLVTGPNGAGKTNLLESLHLGTQGFSPRTRLDAQVIRHGAPRARVCVAGARGAVTTTCEVTIDRTSPKRAILNGAPVRAAEHLRRALTTLVFTPDRLAVVKGGPAARRAYFDRVLARALPARAELPLQYAAAVGHRNAALRSAADGRTGRDTIDPWTTQVASIGAELVLARRQVLDLLSPGFAAIAAGLGLDGARVRYDGDPPTTAGLEARLERDLERRVTGDGPHLHDVAILSDDRDLRTFGSQGEQRLAVLALILAEAEALPTRAGELPLLLLDDALSELDADRRRVLSERLGAAGQAVVTATGAEALPLAPSQLLVVSPGTVCRG